jgi:hypothetical protein
LDYVYYNDPSYRYTTATVLDCSRIDPASWGLECLGQHPVEVDHNNATMSMEDAEFFSHLFAEKEERLSQVDMTGQLFGSEGHAFEGHHHQLEQYQQQQLEPSLLCTQLEQHNLRIENFHDYHHGQGLYQLNTYHLQ